MRSIQFELKIDTLVLEMKQGDKEAFEQFYEESWNWVCYFVRKRIRNQNDVEDVAQEIMLSIYQNISNLKDVRAFPGWIHTIIFRHCMRWLDKSKTINSKQECLSEESADYLLEQLTEDNIEFLPEELLVQTEFCAEITDMVSDLPEEQRESILMFYYGNLSVAQIAEILETTNHAVEIKLSKARATLRKQIDLLRVKSGSSRRGYRLFSFVPLMFASAVKRVVKFTAMAHSAVAGKVAVGVAVTVLSGAGGVLIYETLVSNTVVDETVSVFTTSPPSSTFIPNVTSVLTPEPTLTPTRKPTPVTPETTASTPTATPILITLADLINGDDIELLRSLSAIYPGEKNDELVALVQRNGLSLVDQHINFTSPDNSYLIYSKEAHGYRLMIAQSYDALRDEWSAVYQFDISNTPVPSLDDWKALFKKAHNE